jgi:sarcosine oxidase subunit alpha
MSGAFRTASGGRIDRGKPLLFTFDGNSYTGFQGDTLASALLANGVHLIGRSFKYRRPRGILSAGSEEPNALVTVTRGGGRVTPNLRATQVELYDGLVAQSQNCWPSLQWDIGAISGMLAPLFSAGFYYKTFMGPRFLGSNRAWTHIYEPLIRRAAGLGRAATSPDPDHYAGRYAHCDVLVVGAGPAGLSAALVAAEAGARVILCDEQSEFGGSLLSETVATIDHKPATEWLSETIAALAKHDRVRLLPRTQAFGYFHDNMVALAERVTDHLADLDPTQPRERLWQVFAKEVVLAAGAVERPLVFSGNDRPGIMLADAGRTYLERYGVTPGKRAVLAGSHGSIYRAALALQRHGVVIAGVVDTRPDPVGEWMTVARDAGLPVITNATITGTEGRLRVSGVRIGRAAAGGAVSDAGHLACDHLLMSAGWTPSVHLFSQSRGKLAWDAGKEAFLPGQSHARERSAGACAGVDELAAVITSGFAAGQSAARAAGMTAKPPRSAVRIANAPSMIGGSLGALPHDGEAKHAFVDFQNDVTTRDLALAAREGFRSIEHVKRYTTTGMATDQGRTSNMNALAIVSRQLNKPLPQVGLTTFRVPYTPVTFGTLAGHSRGELFDPVRRTPIDPWAKQQDAVFEDVGLWKRAHYFPKTGEDMHRAVARECQIVRASVGVFDASTLGKIEVVGPDAAEFLERLYVNAWKRLEVGRCRYGILLNEAGFVIDDGVVGRMASDVFHVTTTTGGAPRVLHMMEDYLQTEFPELQCWLTSTTEQWAVIAVQGPRARDVLAPLVEGIDLAKENFPHMAVREAIVAGVPARVFRVSFTGELGFEINVPADYGRAVWEAVWNEVRRCEGCAYGTETMHVLRAEKGFVIVGQETDGTVTPDDLGLNWAIGKKKKDFVGKRSLARPDMLKADRPQLVGLKTRDPKTVLEEGAQVTKEPKPASGTRALGHVTSSYWSPTLNSSIALALVSGGRNRIAEQLYVPMPSGAIAVEVVSPVFYDPKGARLDG